ncbi:MAG: P-II family nitrogen regulator [Methanomassiliicoccales archaeon]
MSEGRRMELIITIVRKGWADTALEASRKAGAEGGTILFGRGCGVHERKTFLGLMVEPEKEILLTTVSSDIKQKVLDAIVQATKLNEPGNGMAMVLPLNEVIGKVHMTGECLG